MGRLVNWIGLVILNIKISSSIITFTTAVVLGSNMNHPKKLAVVNRVKPVGRVGD